MRRGSALVVVVALAIACGAGASSGGSSETAASARRASAAPIDPCDGAELSLGEAARHCRVEGDAGEPPASEVVEVTIATRSLASGRDGLVEVVFRNASDAPIDLAFPGSLHFDASIWSGERRVDERWEISGIAGGSIGCRAGADCRTVRVRLAPRGTLAASLPMSGRVVVLRDAGAGSGSVARSDGGPIAPGDYELRVMLPWMDRVAGSTTGARIPRILRAPLAITAR